MKPGSPGFFTSVPLQLIAKVLLLPVNDLAYNSRAFNLNYNEEYKMSLSVPLSNQLVFAAANEVKIFPVHFVPLTIGIPAGTTLRVEQTCSPGTEIDAGTASWELWPHGDKAGPFSDSLTAMVTALRFTCVSVGGKVNLV